MRYPEGHKQIIRERIVRSASRALRLHGISGISIPALMGEAGLTHGGFYAHFKNRDELVAEAVRHAANGTAEGVFADENDLVHAMELYLSRGHLDHPEAGCVLAALGTDGPRQAKPIRNAFADVARGFIDLMQRKLDPQGKQVRPSNKALERAATIVGAVVLGRLVDDPQLAERILIAARTTSLP